MIDYGEYKKPRKIPVDKPYISPDDFISEFKSAEDVSQTIHLVDNLELQRVVQAWSNCTVIYRPFGDADDIEHVEWDKLWVFSEHSMEELSEKSGVPIGKVEIFFNIAKGNKLIYPDGSVNLHAIQFIKGTIVKYLKKLNVG
jgi:hypothetical protein